MRVDQKEDLIRDLCDEYGLTFDYAWGRYYLSGVGRVIAFYRDELEGWGPDRIEEAVMAFVIESGVW
jgi:hypothetical protein